MEEYGAEIVETEPAKPGDAGVARAIGTTNVSSIFWDMKHIRAQGQFQLNFFFEDPRIVNAASQVAVSITELNAAGVPHLGNANMGILNVVPLDDGTIFVRGHVDFSSRLLCRLNFIIVN